MQQQLQHLGLAMCYDAENNEWTSTAVEGAPIAFVCVSKTKIKSLVFSLDARVPANLSKDVIWKCPTFIRFHKEIHQDDHPYGAIKLIVMNGGTIYGDDWMWTYTFHDKTLSMNWPTSDQDVNDMIAVFHDFMITHVCVERIHMVNCAKELDPRMNYLLFSSLLQQFEPGSVVPLEMFSDSHNQINWDLLPLSRWKFMLKVNFIPFGKLASALLHRDNVYEIRSRDGRFYTKTSFQRALYYQTTQRDFIPKELLVDENTALGQFINRTQVARLKHRELCRVAIAFRSGKAWLDNGRFHINRDVGSIIAHYVLLMQSSVIHMDIVTPNIHDPKIRHYKMHLRQAKRRRIANE